MAKQQDIEETYNFIDEIFCLSFGENADLTCAWYNGDFSKRLFEKSDKSASRAGRTNVL